MSNYIEHKWKRFGTNEKIENIEETLLTDNANAERNDTKLKVIVGADSQVHRKFIKYVAVIIVINEGKGGRIYFSDNKIDKHVSRRQRLFMETYQAVDVAVKINPILEKVGLEVNEIHADVNPNSKYASSEVVQLCLGYIVGMGFVGKAKPEAWASSCVADARVR